MVRTVTQLKHELGEPAGRYNVSGEEIWRWHCSCLAVQLEGESLKWSPCEHHRPADWADFPEDE